MAITAGSNFALECQSDRGQPEAHRHQGDHVGRDHPERHRLEAARLRLVGIRLEGRKEIVHDAPFQKDGRTGLKGTVREGSRPRQGGAGRDQMRRKLRSGPPPRSARTVSPATAFWPRPTSTRVPTGR